MNVARGARRDARGTLRCTIFGRGATGGACRVSPEDARRVVFRDVQQFTAKVGSPGFLARGRALEGSRVQICAERWSVDAGKPGRPRSILREYVQLARARTPMSIDRVRGTCNTTLCRRSPAQRDGMLLGSWKSDRIRNNIELTTSLEAEFAALQTERITAGVAWRPRRRRIVQAPRRRCCLGEYA